MSCSLQYSERVPVAFASSRVEERDAERTVGKGKVILKAQEELSKLIVSDHVGGLLGKFRELKDGGCSHRASA
ncbi:hypothetical protein CGZ80_14750 [Rhodopirellula sp. MGV]|nr:hypothetical protein CGZ80_14750 [Rhodopirellula sp. MGV]PNY35278.1 hypothetical protein C2E31_19240 [Rhodopirellula baltica]